MAMLEIIGMVAAGVAGVGGHVKSKSFVERRLRYSSLAENPALGVIAGAAAAILAAPVVAIVPFVGAGTALAFGVGVGTGVTVGASRARRGGIPDEY
jgi:hypothetical protein